MNQRLVGIIALPIDVPSMVDIGATFAGVYPGCTIGVSEPLEVQFGDSTYSMVGLPIFAETAS